MPAPFQRLPPMRFYGPGGGSSEPTYKPHPEPASCRPRRGTLRTDALPPQNPSGARTGRVPAHTGSLPPGIRLRARPIRSGTGARWHPDNRGTGSPGPFPFSRQLPEPMGCREIARPISDRPPRRPRCAPLFPDYAPTQIGHDPNDGFERSTGSGTRLRPDRTIRASRTRPPGQIELPLPPLPLPPDGERG